VRGVVANLQQSRAGCSLHGVEGDVDDAGFAGCQRTLRTVVRLGEVAGTGAAQADNHSHRCGAGIVDGNGLRHAIGADGLRRKNQSGRRERYARRAAVPAERCGLPDALSEMVRVALTGPAACGSPKCRGTVNRKLPDA